MATQAKAMKNHEGPVLDCCWTGDNTKLFSVGADKKGMVGCFACSCSLMTFSCGILELIASIKLRRMTSQLLVVHMRRGIITNAWLLEVWIKRSKCGTCDNLLQRKLLTAQRYRAFKRRVWLEYLESVCDGLDDADHGRRHSRQEAPWLQNGQRSVRVESIRVTAQAAIEMHFNLQE